MTTKREIWLRNLKEILMGCNKDKNHPVTYFMNDVNKGYLSTPDGPLIKEHISSIDIFECFGIKNETVESVITKKTTLMVGDKISNNCSNTGYDIVSNGMNLSLFFIDECNVGHIVYDPKNQPNPYMFPHGYTLEELNDYWMDESSTWELIPKPDPNSVF
jgi:hypothetical protein